MKVLLKGASVFFIFSILCSSFPGVAGAQTEMEGEPAAQAGVSEQKPQSLTLAEAVMCEKVENTKPINKSIIFSVSTGQVCCFTTFNPVPEPTIVYHRWYHRDDLSTQIRLKLYSPQWSTYSLIQLRDTDKGPWRVEITDRNGVVLDVLQFSITD